MKRVARIISLALVFAMLLGISAMAAQRSLGAGFYGIGSAKNVTIEARDANNKTDGVTTTTATVGSGTKVYHEGSARLAVTYSGTAEEGDQFLVLLATGDALPTREDAIWYIDQTAKESGSITFDVYPMAPTKATDMTLFITSDNEDFTTIAIPVSYAPNGTYTEAPYKLGDVNEDTYIRVNDAVLVLEQVVGKTTLTGNGLLAADTNLDTYIRVNDAVLILEYVVGKIDSFT